jgi:TRAP-type C4-dicarboxylate transport system permease small subunit
VSEIEQQASSTSGVINRIDKGISHLEAFVMAAGVVLMAINTITNVISRFVFNHSIIFAEELNSIFILLVTFAGIGYAARHGRHIRMSAVYDSLSLPFRKHMMILITAITGLCMLFLAWFAVEYILHIASKGRVMPALGIPVYLTYLWVPVGFFITGVQYLLTCRKNIQSDGDIYLSIDLKDTDSSEQ